VRPARLILLPHAGVARVLVRRTVVNPPERR